MTSPRLSVIVPAYNVEAYVEEAVRSALAQTMRDLEVVVVDDGSTDRTAAIVSMIDDPRVRLVRKPNGGLSSARNAGIAAAHADLLGFLDADDRWRPDKARRHLDALEAESGVGITFSHSAYIDEAGEDLGRVLYTSTARPTLRQAILRNRFGNGSTPVIRAECFRVAGTFDETLRSCEDWEMWVRILRDTSFTALLVPDVLTEYRINTRSLSMDFSGFTRNAERAAMRIGRETPGVSRAVVQRGLAQSYRIAGTKALGLADRRQALRLIGKAVSISPLLVATDHRLAGTLLAACLPGSAVSAAHRIVARTLRLVG